jgi:hypothetical protein
LFFVFYFADDDGGIGDSLWSGIDEEDDDKVIK